MVGRPFNANVTECIAVENYRLKHRRPLTRSVINKYVGHSLVQSMSDDQCHQLKSAADLAHDPISKRIGLGQLGGYVEH